MKIFSSPGFETGFEESPSLNFGTALLGVSGAFADGEGLSNVPPSLGKAGTVVLKAGFVSAAFGAAGEAGADAGAAAKGFAGSATLGAKGSAALGVAVSSGALYGLKAVMDESYSNLSNSSIKLSLSELNWKMGFAAPAVLSIFSFVSLSLSATDSALSPGLNCTAKEESIKSSLPLGLLAPLKLKSSGLLGISLISFYK